MYVPREVFLGFQFDLNTLSKIHAMISIFNGHRVTLFHLVDGKKGLRND